MQKILFNKWVTNAVGCIGISLSPFLAANSDQVYDPIEPVNRIVFEFNDLLDRYLLKPTAQGYQFITPKLVDDSISNFFNNLGEVSNIANNSLQGKFEFAISCSGRLVFNTFFGMGGLFDVASDWGLPERKEDFGQTLGYWGLGPGPYLMLPLMGPSNIRDAIGRVPDSVYLDPVAYAHRDLAVPLMVLNIVDVRADLLRFDGFETSDKYLFVRNAYMQKRAYDVNDGQVDDPFAEQELPEDFEY